MSSLTGEAGVLEGAWLMALSPDAAQAPPVAFCSQGTEAGRLALLLLWWAAKPSWGQVRAGTLLLAMRAILSQVYR